MNEKLREMLQKHEGLRLKPYRCTAGKLSIGFGRNLDDKGITEEEANWLLSNDIEEITQQAQDNFQWFDSLDEVRQNVILDMIYNLGMAGFLKFKLMIHFLEIGDYTQASIEMKDSKWFDQVGDRAKELCKMMYTGIYL